MTSDESLAPGQNRISLSLDTLPIGWYAWRVEAAGHSRTGTLTVAR